MSPLPHGFFKKFTSGRYHRDMKILKILASSSKRFTTFLKNDKKLIMIVGGANK